MAAPVPGIGPRPGGCAHSIGRDGAWDGSRAGTYVGPKNNETTGNAAFLQGGCVAREIGRITSPRTGPCAPTGRAAGEVLFSLISQELLTAVFLTKTPLNF